MFQEEESSHISKEVAKHLHTLFLKSGTSGIIFSDFQCLHNLTLGRNSEEQQWPNSIRELIHLRNLDLSATYIKDIPEWIGELSHLQTLRPSLFVPLKLPNTLKYLINLRHLYIRQDSELPAEIGRLTSLQALPYFTVGEEKGYHIEELRNLKNLKGELTIRNLERVRNKEEALKANILQKQHLSELRFQWGSDCSGERDHDGVLEGLRPHANLKELTIDGYKGKKFPTWLQGEPQGSYLPLHNLIEINLFGCSECEEITWNHLPNLGSLYITQLENMRSLDGLDTLNSLHRLTIQRCENLKLIGKPSCGEGGNQRIFGSMRIIDCEELREFPSQMLELWAPTIEVLELEGLKNLTNLPMLIDCLAKSSHLIALRIIGIPKLMSAGSVESSDLGKLWSLNIDVSVEWSEETSVAINDTVDGILKGCCNSLEILTLRGVGNIGIKELPQWFGNLSALETLRLDGCTKLRCLPSVDSLKPLTKLRWLDIKNCPKQSIDSEWRNHHPKLIITIDGRDI